MPKYNGLFYFPLTAAKEVLSDTEMRQKFDQGEDPLDAEQERERQSGGHGFPSGFHPHPFGGGNQGNFQFKFHFNWYSLFLFVTNFVYRSFGIHLIQSFLGLLFAF